MASQNEIHPIPVIYYHSIGPVHKNWNRHFLTLEPDYFEDQLKFVSKHFETLFLKDYWLIRNGMKSGSDNQVVLTFDDGFLDNWTWAFPLLKKYGLKATIFVCPEFVDTKHGVRPNLENAWKKEVSVAEIDQPGYLSWEEMRLMVSSGLVDIQSHTMSHTKYFVSDRIRNFHHPGNDCLYPVGNIFPEKKPYHILDPAFETLIPYGLPLFEERSSVVANRVWINEDFNQETVSLLKSYDFRDYSFDRMLKLVQPVYDSYRASGKLITKTETEDDYLNRLDYEIAGSKRVIEEKLNKSVEFLCWPHGDNNELAHDLAIRAGYLATSSGSNRGHGNEPDRIPARIGPYKLANSRMLTLLKLRYKTGSALNRFPYRQINTCYNLFRYGKSG